MWNTLALMTKRSRSGDCPPALMQELAAVKSGDIELPARTRGGENYTIAVRCVVEADKALSVLLERLGLPLPTRLQYKPQVPTRTEPVLSMQL